MILLLSIVLTFTQSVSFDNGMDSNILSGYLNIVGVCNIILILIQEPEKSNILQPFYLMLGSMEIYLYKTNDHRLLPAQFSLKRV